MRAAPKIIAQYLENFTTNDVYDILKDMGYKFDYITLSDANGINIPKIYKKLKKLFS